MELHLPLVGKMLENFYETCALKGHFHPACRARAVSLFASVAAIFMVHENGDEQRQAKR